MNDTKSVSRPYRPTAASACERCCFGNGQHEEWCEWRTRFVEGSWNRVTFFDPEKWKVAGRAGNRTFMVNVDEPSIMRYVDHAFVNHPEHYTE